MAIRKSAWEKIKNTICHQDSCVHEDTDLAIHLGKIGKIKVDSMLVVASSFRRYKKLYTYYEYPKRLFQTLNSHKK